ncbi:Endonuclease/exonuclease/phosphatase [Gilbertella persicaria]|uniref:sphingomyelin phosphodiesterase n=1 Tax=Rhizopus stolonifer TaxID=4846 RepID=A0A367KIK8_RHIST|nr:Endonuclease/exonuclease/phosphatase [Gilbertella persicaria]KAI8069793.1 Endonuclease/exonuclease/phosphatase [Gilbertella persicaria]RCI02063.1 Sphingomyelin phosphodiesterase 2, neutral membrane (Neutral sphingomyelinase) [Rhizopus stolonifer]
MSSVPAVPTIDRRDSEQEAEVPMPTEPYHDEEEEPTVSEGEQDQENRRMRSYEASVVSVQSNPPPYELYPPAKTAFGRFFNWLRQIPQWNTHQPIYLPTIHNSGSSSGRSIFSLGRRHRRTASTTSSGSSISSTSSVSCWSYYYFAITDRLPERPRFVLPSFLAKHRLALIVLSFFSLVLFSFLLFCSIFFSASNYPAPVFPDKTTNSTARFLTLNIFMRPPLIKNNWSDYKDDRLAYIEKYILPEYDVICFQESFAFASKRKDRLITSARKLGFNYHVESPRKYPWNIGVDGGLLIVSRFPIRQADVIEYPRGQHSDWLSIKGALHAHIELNATRKIHLYTTHTQASYDLNNVINEDDTAIRLSQFAILHQFIYDTSRQDNNQDPIMVVGDLNVDAAVHSKERPITQPSKESSPEYVKMVDVIRGTGVLKSNSDGRWFEHPWKLDNLTDIVYDHYGYHPVTFGDYKVSNQGELVPAETVLTNWDVLMTVQSIDRIFLAPRYATVAKLQSPRVEKFWVEENDQMTDEEKKNTGFTQISDHYGLSCEIQLL